MPAEPKRPGPKPSGIDANGTMVRLTKWIRAGIETVRRPGESRSAVIRQLLTEALEARLRGE